MTPRPWHEDTTLDAALPRPAVSADPTFAAHAARSAIASWPAVLDDIDAPATPEATESGRDARKETR